MFNDLRHILPVVAGAAVIVVIACEGDDQIQIRDDKDKLTAVALSKIGGMSAEAPDPPLVAVIRPVCVVELRGGRFIDSILGNDLLALPFSPVQVQQPEAGHVSCGQGETVSAV